VFPFVTFPRVFATLPFQFVASPGFLNLLSRRFAFLANCLLASALTGGVYFADYGAPVATALLWLEASLPRYTPANTEGQGLVSRESK
jgi:hypothetical protein